MWPGRRIIAGVRVSNLFDVPGKPFGWAHHEERRLIRAHLDRRYGYVRPGTIEWSRRELGVVNRIQRRLHKYDLPYRELQKLYASSRPPPVGTAGFFTWAELERMAEHFDRANDPISAAIAVKALALLDTRKDER